MHLWPFSLFFSQEFWLCLLLAKISYLAKLNTLPMLYFTILSIGFSGIIYQAILWEHQHLAPLFFSTDQEKINPVILLIYFLLVLLFNAWNNFHIFSVNNIYRFLFLYLYWNDAWFYFSLAFFVLVLNKEELLMKLKPVIPDILIINICSAWNKFSKFLQFKSSFYTYTFK